jgi:hypothetical protein
LPCLGCRFLNWLVYPMPAREPPQPLPEHPEPPGRGFAMIPGRSRTRKMLFTRSGTLERFSEVSEPQQTFAEKFSVIVSIAKFEYCVILFLKKLISGLDVKCSSTIPMAKSWDTDAPDTVPHGADWKFCLKLIVVGNRLWLFFLYHIPVFAFVQRRIQFLIQ